MKNLFYALLLLPITTFSQTSIIQDQSGESSLIFGNNKTVLFSSSDASIATNLSFFKSGPEREPSFWGFNLKFKANDGVSKLLEGYNFKPKFNLGFFKGFYIKSAGKSTSKNVYFNTEINNSYFKLLTNTTQNTLTDKSFFGWRLKTGFNILSAIKESSVLGGVSVEYGSYNNLEDLDNVERYETNTVTNQGTTTTTLMNRRAGFSGNYSDANMLKINGDFILFPSFLKRQVGVGIYGRAGLGGTFARQNAGVGIFLGKKGAPDKVVMGLVYQINDVFNQVSDEPSFQKRSGINLTAGYNF